jgi:hypothetical protein
MLLEPLQPHVSKTTGMFLTDLMHRPDLGRINSDEIPRLALAASMRSAAGANLSPQGVRAEGRKLESCRDRQQVRTPGTSP